MPKKIITKTIKAAENGAKTVKKSGTRNKSKPKPKTAPRPRGRPKTRITKEIDSNAPKRPRGRPTLPLPENVVEKNISDLLIADSAEPIPLPDFNSNITELPPEEKYLATRKGGLTGTKTGGAVRWGNREKARNIQKTMQMVLAMRPPSKITKGFIRKTAKANGYTDITFDDAIQMAQAIKAIRDEDTAAAIYTRDTAGFKPIDRNVVASANLEVTQDNQEAWNRLLGIMED